MHACEKESLDLFDFFMLWAWPAGPGFQGMKTTSDGKILARALIWRDEDYLGRQNPGRGADLEESAPNSKKRGVPEAPAEVQT